MKKHVTAIFSSKQRAEAAQRSAGGAAEKLPFKRRLVVESLEQRVLLSADPLAVARVAGSIDSAGEVDRFTFHLDGAARVAFDSLTEDGNLRWSLQGPGGTLVSPSSFQAQSASNPGVYAPLELGPGDYEIDVSGVGDHTGAYGLRLMDVARASAMTLDSTVSGTIDEQAKSEAFVFDGQAGDNLFLRWSNRPNDAYLRVYDPYGQQVGNTFGYEAALPTLAYTGRYTVLLDTGNGTPASAAYAFQLHKMVAPVQELGSWSGDVLPVTGSIAAPGDLAVVHFSLAAPRTVVLDSRTWNDSFNLTLSGANGIVRDSTGQALSLRGLGHYADHAYYGSNLVELAAGDYTLTLDANDNLTGAFDMRLLDVAAGTLVDKGTVVSGTLNPAAALQVYRFDASAGDRIDFDALSTSNGSPSWKLLDAWGRVVSYAWNFGDVSNITLASTGRYTLLVSGENGRDGSTDYSFKLVDAGHTTPVLPTGSALAIGAVAQGSIAAAGDTQVWNFTLDHDTTLYFDPQTATPDYAVYWSLTGPRGDEVVNEHFGYYYGEEGGRVLKLVAGQYALSVRSNNAAVPDYRFRLVDLAGAAPLTVGQPTTGQLDPGSASAAYTFNAALGQRLFFRSDATSNGNLRWKLVDPKGALVVTNNGWSDWSGTASLAGTYTLIVEGFNAIGSTPIDYTFTLFQPTTTDKSYDPAISTGVQPVWTSDGAQPALQFNGAQEVRVEPNAALNLAHNVSVQTRFRVDSFENDWQSVFHKGSESSDAGQRTYTLWVNRNGYLHFTTSDSWGEMYVQTPAGSIQAGTWYDFTGVIDRDTGSIKIYLGGTEVASAAIRTNVSDARVQDTPLYLGNAHEYWGSYGSRLHGAISEFRLWDQALSAAEVTQYQSGTPSAADSHLKLWLKLDEGSGTALADASASGLQASARSLFEGMSGVAAGYLTQPGQAVVYHLDLPQAGRYYLDTLTPYTNSYGAGLQFVVSGPRTGINDNASYYYNRVLDLPAGPYTITVQGNGRATGPYAFRLLDVASAQAINAGQAVSGSLEPGDTAKLYRFHANAGDTLYLQSLGASGFNPAWRLIDPFGREVFGRNGLGDRELGVGYSGDYLLIVDGDAGQNDSRSSYGFVVRNVTPTTPQAFDINTGTDTGLALRDTGRSGGGAVQVSDRQYLEFPDAPGTDLTGSYTLETWFRVDRMPAGDWIPLLTKTTPEGQRQYGVFVHRDGQVYVGSAEPGQGEYGAQSPAGTVSAGAWTHVAAVFDRVNSIVRVYVNGTQVATGYLNPAAGVNLADKLRVGYNTEGHNFHGYQVTVDEVSLWNGARSAEQIQADAAASLAGAESGLAALFKLDEASGRTLADSSGGGASGRIERVSEHVGGLVTGRLSEPGQTQRYTFTLTEDKQLYFDSFTRRSDLRWTLKGPATSVGDSFYYGDSSNNYNLLTLSAGSYEIVVDGDGAATGDFMFRLVDVAGARGIDVGTIVSDRLDPGAVAKLFRFEGTAGQRLFLDTLSYDVQQPAWRLLDPTGAQVFGVDWFRDRDPVTLSRSGTYTLIVEDYGSSGARNPARNFSFRLLDVADTTQPLSLGSSQFRGPQWVGGPDEQNPNAVGFDGSRQIVTDPSAALELSGDFTLEALVRVDGYGNTWTPIISRADGSWSHQTYGLWVGSSGQVNFDSNWQGNGWAFGTANNAITLGGWNRISVSIDRTHGVGRIYVNGVQLAQSSIDGRAPLALPEARLRVGSTDIVNGDRAELQGAVADVRIFNTVRTQQQIEDNAFVSLPGSEAGLVFNLQLDEGSGSVVTDSAPGHIATRITGLNGELGATVVEGSIQQPGSRVIYQLQPAQDSRILFDSLTPDSRFLWTLLGPDGVITDNYGQSLQNRRLRDSDGWSRVFFNLKAGQSYQLVVDAEGDATGNFAFRLANFADAQLIAYDTTVEWKPAQARSTGLFAFDAAAGDQIVLDRLGYSDPRPVWRLYGPSGNELYSNDFYYDSGTLTLGYSGRYVIALEGGVDARGQVVQSFQVQKVGTTTVTPPTGSPVSFVNGVAELAGTTTAVDTPLVFNFTLDHATRVYVDGLNGYPGYYSVWTLQGASGVVDSRNTYNTDSNDLRSWYELPAGSYSFSVYTPSYWSWALGNLKFRLVDLDSAQPLTMGTPVSGTLTPANGSTFYRFTGSAGQRLYLDAGSSSNMSAYWRLVHADTGAEVSGNWWSNDLEVTLNRNGEYLLYLEGQRDNGAASASFSFTPSLAGTSTQAMTLDSTVSGSLANPGDTARYTFTLDGTKRLWWDGLSPRSDISVSILDADGVPVVGSRNIRDYAWWWQQGTMTLSAGSYTLVIDGDGAATGSYAFALRDLSAAQAITPGTTVSGQLTPANETDLYKFQASAGQRFFFDVQSRSGGNTYWRLLDPYGAPVFSQEGLNDHGTTTLAYTGTYTLLIEGYPDDGGTVSYGFNVTPVLQQQPVQLTIGVQPGPNLVVQELAAVGGDGSVHSGGVLNVSWKTANTGDRPADGSFQERVIVKNAGGETIANVLVPYDGSAGGAIAAGTARQRSVQVSLPAGARGAGLLTVTVLTDVGNAIVEAGSSAENDNSAALQVDSTLLLYPDLSVSRVTVTPATGLASGQSVTVAWRVSNVGEQATANRWSDRVVVRNRSTGEVVLDQLSRVGAAGSTLAAGAWLNRQLSFTWPAGRNAAGEFEVVVTADALGEIPEYNAGDTGELNNAATLSFVNAPDLQAGGLQVLNAAPAAGDLLNLQWTVRNQGNAPTPTGWYDRLLIVNTATNETLLNADVFYDPVQATGSALAAGGSVVRSFSVRLPEGTRSVGTLRITVIADQNASGASTVPESNEVNNAFSMDQAVVERPYANLAVDSFTAPAAQRSGDDIHLRWTVVNRGNAATNAAAWNDRVILSRDAVIGNGDDVALASVAHNGALAAGGTYSVELDVPLPGGYDGNYVLAVVTDAFSQVTEPDTRADNTSPAQPVLLTAYHADLVPAFTTVPAAATAGDNVSVSWRVSNQGDAATNSSGWWDELWLSADGTLGGATYLGGWWHSGTLAVGAAYDASATVTLPGGVVGSRTFVLRSDVYNHVFESRFDGNNLVAASTPTAISAAPSVNLAVQSVTAPALAQPGQAQTLQWTVKNTGAGPTRHAWSDRAYISRDGTLTNAIALGTVAQAGPLAAGASYQASLQFTMPQLDDGAWTFLVVSDVFDEVFESGVADAESNARAAAQATQLSHPDVVARTLQLSAAPTGGAAATLSWTLRNNGTGATKATSTTRVYLSADDVLGGGDVLLGEVSRAAGLAAGAAVAQQLSFTLPLTAAGSYRFFVVTDATDALQELAAGEANNAASLQASIAQAPLPDLRVSGIQAPATAVAGRPLSLSWTVANAGNKAASGGWSEQVWLSDDGGVGADQLLATFYYGSNDIAAGGSVTRSETVNLPAFASGSNYRLVVRVDTGLDVTEHEEGDNAAIDDAAVAVAPALSLQLSRASVGEQEGAGVVTGTVTRSGPTTSALTVLLASSLGELALPQSVVIPAGQSAASFSFGVLDNALVDGSRDGTVTVAAAGFEGTQAALRVTDNDVPALTLGAALTTLDEGHGPLALTLTRNTLDLGSALTVALSNNRPYKLDVPATVVIPAGQRSVSFNVTPVNDTAPEGDRTVDVSASAVGFGGAGVRLQILDNDIPTLTLDIANPVVSEGVGVAATQVTITRSIVSDSGLRVQLGGDVGRMRLPNYVVIEAGQASVSFDVSVIDNELAEGDRTVTLGAMVADSFTGVGLPATRVEKTLLITDNDGPTLSLSIDRNVLGEGGGAATATVTRNTATGTDLVVHLSSSDATEATVAQTVVIRAGQSSATFAVNPVSDGVQDGTQAVTLVAAAQGFNSGSVGLQVTDRELADLQLGAVNLSAPAAPAGASLTLSWTVVNQGLGAASGTWSDNVFLSSDAVLSADDQLVGSFSGATPLEEGASYTRSVTLGLGQRVGKLWAFVVTDGGKTVSELNEANNVRAGVVEVTAPYVTTNVAADIEQVVAGTPVQIQGDVVDAVTGALKPFALLSVKVMSGGTVRSIDAVSDKNGHFKATFKPLPGEAGHYTVAVVYPGVSDYAAQDSFDILGMQLSGGISASLIPGQTVQGTLTLRNLSPVALSGLAAQVGSLPPGVTLSFDVPASLAGDGTVQVGYTLSVGAEVGALSGGAPITLSADGGVSATANLSLSVNPLRPQLVANPGYLTAGMLRGNQSSVSFQVTNTGGAATGALQVQLPAGTDWLSLASASTLASLAPGESATVTLLLKPGADMALQLYQGSINVTGASTFATVPFQFRAVSEAVGDVHVVVQDEYTFFAEDKPNVAGATVELLDVYSGALIASAVTGADGTVDFTGIAEGPYTLQVSAAKHDSSRAIVHVTPGGVDSQEIFLHRQAVTYNWTVVPTEIQDHYKIVLESTFETEVPMPVVTVDEPFIMPWIIPGYETQFNITLRNHGLINAEHVQIQVPNDPDYVITPLISELPVLAAKSEATIPCTIRLSEAGLAKLAASGGGVSASGPGSALIKCLGMGTIYTYECRNGQWVQVPIRLAPTVGCLEGIKDAAKSIPEYLAERGAGNLLSAGCDVISLALDCIEAATGEGLSDCETALLTSVCKAAAGAAVGGPVGALGGLASNWSDILACLCSLDFGLGGGGGSTGGGGGGGGGWSWGGGSGGPGAPYTVPVTYSVPTNCSNTASAGAGTDLGSIDGALQSQSNGVCAEVRLRIEQEAVITRTAFAGTLELNNGRSDTTLSDVYLTLDIRDAAGNAANDKFLVRGPKLSGVTVGADGKITVNPSSTGKLEYTFVPTNDAAPDQPELYTIGGTLHYKDGDTVVEVPLLAAKITVNPEAALKLDYFWQRDVIGDDPFTEEVEPSDPFALGLQVVNVGKGGAGKLTITSAQPQIVENEKGLLVDFKIVGSQVGADAATPSLTVALGNIAPGETKTAQWNLISSLQGKFKDFSASFEHLDDDGDLRTSLIKSVTIHELTRAVYLTSPASDGIPDYLVNDVPDDGNLPDTLYFSTGGQAPVTLATGAQLSGGTLQRTLTASMQPGWSYLQVGDPLPGYELVSVVRSDGKVLPLNGMVWRTNRTFKAGEPGATLENLIKLVDLDSTGSYTLSYAIVDHVAPALQALTGPGAGLQTAAVDAVDVSFSELVDESTLTAADFTLLRNGQSVPVPALALSFLGNNTWRVSGLGGATGADGNYKLVFNAQGITDLAGNAGTGSAAVEWAKGVDAPVVVSVAAGAAVRNTALDSVDVSFSRPMDAASIDFADLALTRDGAAVALFSNVTVTQLNATTVRFSGLAAYTQADGAYVLTVQAGGTLDADGVAGTGQASAGWRMDAAAPTASFEAIATDPRNTVLMALEVSFSEPIAAASFDRNDLRLTRNGGANLITSEVTVEQVDATTWRIQGFNWKSGLDGVYVLTLDARGIQDLAGNAGTGTVSRSWTMDTVDPLAASHLVLSPDRGISNTDGRTNTTALTLTGQLSEAGLTVRLTDVTSNKELGYAKVQGTQFSADFNLSGPGAHRIRVRAVDAAGNVAPDSFVDVFVDTTAPGIAALGALAPNPRSTPVTLLEVQLDEAINPAGFTFADLALTRDGVAVALDATVQVQNVEGNLWRITGLQGFTAAPGAYVLTVSATGLRDLAGNAGVGAKSVAWTTLASLPTSLRGQVYEDLDGSGTLNPAHWNPEAGIAGRTVFLDADGDSVLDDGELSTTTDAEGKYAFENLGVGHYRVIQQLPNGWIVTSSVAAHEVDLAEGHVASGLDFGDFRTGVLSGRVFDDLDADGTQDAGEQAVAGRTVFLDRDADGEIDAGETSTTTDAQGRFGFSGVGPGTVAVTQLLPAGRQRTTPVVPVNIKSGTELDSTLGDVLVGSISGMKFEDSDGDGTRDVGERGIEGWTIFLDANGNGALDAGERSTLTDALGYYSFVNLLPGRYTVAELQREGWTQTSPLPGAAAAGITTAASDVAMEVDCACGQSWATVTGPAMVDYGKLSIDTALATTGISQLQQQQPTLDGRGVTTVVIDTGIDLDHRFFGGDSDGNGIADRILYQWDFADGDADASDVNGHGSHIASVIGSQDTLYRGVATGTDLIALKVFEDSGRGYFSYLEKALQWVLANHVQYHIGVVNLSLGDNGNWTSEASRYGIGDELAALAQTDVIVVAAAGNNYLQFGRMGVAYPGSDPAAIAVGATWSADFGGPWTVSTGATSYSTGVDEIAAFSQRDTSLLDGFAPGARFNGASANGGIQTMQGTSQAAAFVSGAAALAQQIARQTLGRGLSTGEFAQLMRSTGDLIMDGDDEVDNVANTGQKFPRLDMVKLAAAIATLGAQPTPGGSGGDTGTGNSGDTSTPAAQPAAEGVHTVDLGAGGAEAGKDFGNFKLGAVAGTVFDDADADGVRDAGEGARAGVTVFLDSDGNAQLDAGERSLQTGADGGFRFDGLQPGTVQLRVVAPSGVVVTGAALRTLTVTSGLDAQGSDFSLHTVPAPVAQADSTSAQEDGELLIDVLANDDTAASEGVQLSFGQGAHGSVVLHDGRLLYVPQANFNGSDSFSYTLTDRWGRSSSATVNVQVLPVNDAPSGKVTIAGTARQGQVLTASNTLADADGLGPITYQWLRGGKLIAGATGASYKLVQADVGQAISVRAAYTDGYGKVERVTSAATAAVVNVNDVPKGSVTIAGTAEQNQTLTASNTLTDADGLGPITYQWLRGGEAIEGATGESYRLTQADVGQLISVRAAYTDGFGKAESVTSAATAAVANVNDAPSGEVTIGGLAAQGQVLTASHTLDDLDGLGDVSWQWLRGGEVIEGATGESYTLTQADVGQLISVRAAYTDGFGKAESVTSVATAAVVNVNDAPSGKVTIAGTARQGQVLTASNTLADVDGLGPITYQWLRNGKFITGATGASYKLVQADVGRAISVRAAYTDGYGTFERVISAATAAVVNVNDVPKGSVTIAGTAEQNQTLTASNTLTDADGLGPIAYQWLRGVEAIEGATGESYTLTQADVGQLISVRAAYTDGFGKAESVTSAATAAVANVNDAPSGTVTITGTARQGQVLRASNTLADADGLGAVKYQWLRNGKFITGATGASYKLVQADVGQAISVRAAYTDGYGTFERVTSAATAAVANVNDAPSGTVTITGTARQGQVLTASNTLADVDGLGPIAYQWLRNGKFITGATGASYKLVQADVGQAISVRAAYTDGYGTFERVISAATAAVANVNDAPKGRVTIAGTAEQNQTLTASNTLTDADGLGPITYQWLRGGEVIEGAIRATYALTQADVGQLISVRAAYTDGFGKAESVTSAATAAVAGIEAAPMLMTLGDLIVPEGGVLMLDPAAGDAEGLAYTPLQAPALATAAQDDALRSVEGDDLVRFTVQLGDGAGAAAGQPWRVQVLQGRLVVTGFELKARGFAVRFNDGAAPALPDLHVGQAPEVLVSGQAGGPVGGTVIHDLDGKGFAFIPCAAALAADVYTVTLRAAAEVLAEARQGVVEGGGSDAGGFTPVAAPALRLQLPELPRAGAQAIGLAGGLVTGMDTGLLADDGQFGHMEAMAPLATTAPAAPTVNFGGSFANFALEAGRSSGDSCADNTALTVLRVVPSVSAQEGSSVSA
jgi:hypothetical protein